MTPSGAAGYPLRGPRELHFLWFWVCSPGSRIPLRKKAGPCAGVAPASLCAGARSEIKAGGWPCPNSLSLLKLERSQRSGWTQVPVLAPHHERGLGKARQLLHLKFINLTNITAYLLCTHCVPDAVLGSASSPCQLGADGRGGDRQASRQR